MHPWPAPSVHPSNRRQAVWTARTERRGRQSRTACGAARGPTTREERSDEWSGPEDFGYWLLVPGVGVSWQIGCKRATAREVKTTWRPSFGRCRKTATGSLPAWAETVRGFGRATGDRARPAMPGRLGAVIMQTKQRLRGERRNQLHYRYKIDEMSLGDKWPTS